MNFSEITAFNAMTHPANASDLNLYSTLFAPLYVWLMTCWTKITSLTAENCRLGSIVIYFPIVIFSSLHFAKQYGGNAFYLGVVFVGAPLFLMHGMCCDWMAFSLGFLLLISSELVKTQSSPLKLFTWSFLLIFFQFYNVLPLGVFILLLITQKLMNNEKDYSDLKQLIPIIIAAALALTLALISYEMADERIISFLDYVRIRGSQAIVKPHGVSFFFFTMERIWGQMTYNFPLFILFFLSLGCTFTSPPSKKKTILLSLVLTHFIYCCILIGTTAAHYYYTFFYLLLCPALIANAYHQCVPQLKLSEKIMAMLGIALFLSISLHQLRKNGYWEKQESQLDHFLENMKPDDLLVRDEWFNTWPLNLNNPLNTVYLDPKNLRPEWSKDLSENKVYGYETTWNSVFHARPKYQRWRSYQPGPKGKIYYLTQRGGLPYHEKLKETRHVLHAGTKSFYLYQLTPKSHESL